MKRTISILLIAVMLIGLLSVASAGASASAYVTTARQKTYMAAAQRASKTL